MFRRIKIERPANYFRLVNTINPEILSVLVEGDAFLCGGAIRAAFDKTSVSDFDLFFKNWEAADKVKRKLVNNYYKILFQCPEDRLTTLRLGATKVQIIKERYFQTVENVLDTFDITACQFGLDFTETELVTLVMNYHSLRDARKRKLHLHKVTYPVATYNRLEKYKNKGYKLSDNCVEHFVRLSAQHLVAEEPDMWRTYID